MTTAVYDRFEGLFIPHVTPFDDSGELDLESLERLAAHFAAIPGVAGLVSCARIGEGPVLTLEEKRRVYEIAGRVARRAGRVHVATIAPQSTAEAVALVRDLEKLAVDAVMIFPPLLFAWGEVGGDLKVRFFEELAAATMLPLVLFQVPVKSYWYDVETICRIARLKNVAAFKEASFDRELFAETARRLGREQAAMKILTGNDRFVAESYGLGARGALIGVANLATERWAALDAAGRAGDGTRALAIQQGLDRLKELVFSEPIVEAVARIKAVLRHQGLIRSAAVRKPQLGISAAEQRELLEGYGALAARGPAEPEAPSAV
ncbi:MAG TPA: dihydrodipicolinate synthase family protein [candidate division Zixibacteria bacterium]|nr:dihydrodipicolinate synthase family protein [candidate division Zixibacteria bacterium]